MVGSTANGPDIVARSGTRVTAPQGIGTEAPLAIHSPVIDVTADTIDLSAQGVSPADPIFVNATGVGGVAASDVRMALTSTESVTIGTLFATRSTTFATTPLFTITDGRLGDYAVVYTPEFAIRVDHQNRAFQPGFDVRAFTLSGNYDMIVTPESALIGAYVLTQNPRKVVFSNPGGVADLRGRGQLNALYRNVQTDRNNPASAAGDYATASGGLVFVDPAVFQCGGDDEPPCVDE